MSNLVRYCDNGTEFKGAVQDLCDRLGIKIIRGRAYHPQSQGSVEHSNGVFKARLRAVKGDQPASESKKWVKYLSAIESVMNSTSLSCLPRHTTPDEIWYGRAAWPTSLVDEDESMEEGCGVANSDETEEDEDRQSSSADEAVVLSELSRQVFIKNAKQAERMKAKGGQSHTYKKEQVVTLAIPKKNRMTAEFTRLPCIVTKVVKNSYALCCQWGHLKGLHQSGSLNPVLDGVVYNLTPPLIFCSPNSPKITIAEAVTKSNNRESISAMQKAGALATKLRKERAEKEKKEEKEAAQKRARIALDAQEAEAIVVQDEEDEQFARDVERAVARRGTALMTPIQNSSPTPATRPARKRKAPAKFDPKPVSKRGRQV